MKSLSTGPYPPANSASGDVKDGNRWAICGLSLGTETVRAAGLSTQETEPNSEKGQVIVLRPVPLCVLGLSVSADEKACDVVVAAGLIGRGDET